MRPAPTRLAITAILALYGLACMLDPSPESFLHGVDLAIHETGHLVFGPFGETIGFLGGTLAQLLMPAAFVAYFWHRGDRHAATVPLWWLAQNCWDISVYVADARAQELPLVGGGEHDWAYLLGEAGWLAHDQGIARAFHFVGVMLYIAAIVGGFMAARQLPAQEIASVSPDP